LFASRPRGAAAVAAVVLVTALPSVAAAQKLELRSQSRILLGRSRIADNATLSDKRYSVGFSNTYTEGKDLSHSVAARFDATATTKLQLDTRLQGDDTDWEMKVNQKFRSFTFDVGAGSDGLFHTGVLFGKRKGKGFGFSASWVGDDRRAGANLQLWHHVEPIDVTIALRHDRKGFGWSADTGKNLANILRGVLRYETSSGVDGNGSSQQVIYGRNMRNGADSVTGFDHLRLEPEEDVFGENGVNIRSPLYEKEDPLAWMVEGYGARLGQVDLGTKRLLEAEVVSYVTDNLWLGGEVVMEDGVTEAVDTSFGISADDLNLSASFGYSPDSERFSGSVQFRWTPFNVTPPKP
jgi:hypothetical protein